MSAESENYAREGFEREAWEHEHASPWRKEMAEISMQQMIQAVDAYKAAYDKSEEWPEYARVRGLRAAAPLLQLPWVEPTEIDIQEAWDANARTGGVANVLEGFVRRRNAALLPKPADPRFEKILAGIRSNRTWNLDLEHEVLLAKEILAALDKAD